MCAPTCMHSTCVQTHPPQLHVQTLGRPVGDDMFPGSYLGSQVPMRLASSHTEPTSAHAGHGWEPRHAHGDLRGDPPGAGVASSLDALPHTLLPAAGPPFAMLALISVLCVGRRFQSTSVLFTEPSKNILSPLQASLPEGSGTCPSLCWLMVRCASSGPQFLKGTAGCTPEQDVWAWTQRAAGVPSPHHPSPSCC